MQGAGNLLDEFWFLRQSPFPDPLAETVELMAAAVGEGIVNVEDVLTVLGSQSGDDHFHAFFFIADDAVHIGLMVIAVDGDDRDLSGRFTELADIGFGRKWRADSDDCIDVLIGHSGNIFAVMPCIAAGIGEHDVEMVLPQAIFQQGYGMGIEYIGHVGTDDADDFHGIET